MNVVCANGEAYGQLIINRPIILDSKLSDVGQSVIDVGMQLGLQFPLKAHYHETADDELGLESLLRFITGQGEADMTGELTVWSLDGEVEVVITTDECL